MKTKRIWVGIYRPEWHRGRGSCSSKLFTEEGLRCCLGFAGLRVGFTDAQMLNIPSPAFLYRKHGRSLPNLTEVRPLGHDEPPITDNNSIAALLMSRNDDRYCPEPEREAGLITAAAKAGYRFVFTSSKRVAWLVGFLNDLGVLR